MIFVECYSDQVLARSVSGVLRKDIRHEFKGKGEICRRLRKRSGCWGLVDEDPGSSQPGYLRESALVEDYPELGLRLLRHQPTDNHLVVLCPRLEEWVLAAAKGVGVDVREYGLPNDPRRLHRQIKLVLGRFADLVETLNNSSDRMKVLRRLLQA